MAVDVGENRFVYNLNRSQSSEVWGCSRALSTILFQHALGEGSLVLEHSYIGEIVMKHWHSGQRIVHFPYK